MNCQLIFFTRVPSLSPDEEKKLIDFIYERSQKS